MRTYILQRLTLMLPVVLGVTIVVFLMLHITPGDPVAVFLGTENYNPETAEALRQRLGLNRPLPEQYISWLARVTRGDLGRSIRTNQPVSELIIQAIPPSLQLTAATMLISVTMGFAMGTISAMREGSLLSTLMMAFTVGGLSIPNYWLAILLVYLVALRLGLLPAAGYDSMIAEPTRAIKFLVLPAFCLALRSAAAIGRMLRSSLLEILDEDYIRTARAKGLRERTVVGIHAFRPALIPVMTITGLQASALIGGTIIIETIFAWPGIGKLAADAIFARDFPVVQGVVLVIAIGVIVLNFVVDVLYAYIDPRVRYT